MNLKHFYTGAQGFALGGIAMAYIANYNRSQLPFALICWTLSILFRPNFD